MEVITYEEEGISRKYNFVVIDEETGVVVSRQIENRNGKIFMRSKVRSFV